MSEIPTIKPRRKGRSGTQAMLIPSQQMVVEQIRSAPEGVLTDIGVLRRCLAVQYGADACCPVTVQRHLRAIAELSFGALEKDEPVSTLTPIGAWSIPQACLPSALPAAQPSSVSVWPPKAGTGWNSSRQSGRAKKIRLTAISGPQNFSNGRILQIKMVDINYRFHHHDTHR